LRHQVDVFVVPGRVKGGLKGVRVDDAVLTEHDKARGGLLVFVIGELAVLKTEDLTTLGEEIRKDLDQVVVFVLVYLVLAYYTPIHENISLPAMTMHVTEHYHLIFFVIGSNQLLRVVNGRVKKP
jgi:hypothetical protein